MGMGLDASLDKMVESQLGVGRCKLDLMTLLQANSVLIGLPVDGSLYRKTRLADWEIRLNQ